MNMNLTRFRRMIATRWWALAIVAVLAIWLAITLTDLRNEELPSREAAAVITFNQLLGEVGDEAVLTRLEDSAGLAEDVKPSFGSGGLFSPLAAWEFAAVEIDEVNKELVFIARGDTNQEATERVLEFRKRFLDQNPLGDVADIDGQLAQIATKLAEVQLSIEQATPLPEPPAPPPEEQEVRDAGERAALLAQVVALRAEYATLSVELLNPPIDRTAAQIELARQRVFDELIALELRLATDAEVIGAIEPTEVSADVAEPETSLELSLLQNQSTQLQLAYDALFFQRLNVDLIAEVQTVSNRASSLEPASSGFNAGLALVAALLVGSAALVLIDNGRRLLWSPLDIEGVTTLPEMPNRGWFSSDDDPWYLATRVRPRKAAVQALRAIVDREDHGSGLAIGITGMGVYPQDVQELAADLATSLAISGTTVLLIDANFDDPSHLVEFGTADLTLSRLLNPTFHDEVGSSGPKRPAAHEVDDEQVISDIRRALRQHAEVVGGLKALLAGKRPSDAPDLLARREFALLLQIARDMFDVVVVAGDDIDKPITPVLSQRLDSMILLGAAGRTNALTIEVAVRDFSARRAGLAGVVLLTRRSSLLYRPIAGILTRSRERMSGALHGFRTTPSHPVGTTDRSDATKKPGTAKPDATKKPGTAKPDATKKPGTAKPDATRKPVTAKRKATKKPVAESSDGAKDPVGKNGEGEPGAGTTVTEPTRKNPPTKKRAVVGAKRKSAPGDDKTDKGSEAEQKEQAG